MVTTLETDSISLRPVPSNTVLEDTDLLASFLKSQRDYLKALRLDIENLRNIIDTQHP